MNWNLDDQREHLFDRYVDPRPFVGRLKLLGAHRCS